MPNWSYNTLTINGPREDTERFLTAIEATRAPGTVNGGYSLLRTFVPRPQSVVDDGTWYEWSLTHWGTKWEDEMRLTDTEDGIRMVGETAWAPPIEGYITVSEEFPTLTFLLDFTEEGGYFVGAARIINGSILLMEMAHDHPEFPTLDESISDEDERWEDYQERLSEARSACRDAVTPDAVVR